VINLLIGAPGGGKGYEATVFHILAALARGRKVITNMPLVVERFAALDPAYRELIDLRNSPLPALGTWQPTREAGAFVIEGDPVQPAPTQRAFASVWDFYDTWKHPTKGFGPLFVLDECQYFMPAKGTSPEIEEWFALHRHFNCDVLLMSQSYGKLSRAVVDAVQLVYRVRKNIAFGSANSYVRKVQDGVRGEVVNTSIRTYEAKYFPLWRSHTQGGSVEELNADDVVPLWRHWSFIGAAICALLVIGMLVFTKTRVNPIGVGAKKITKPSQVDQEPAYAVKTYRAGVEQPRPVAAPASAPQQPSPAGVERQASGSDPYGLRTLHVVGHLRMKGREVWSFLVATNGVGLVVVSDADLIAMGYAWQPFNECAGRLTFGSSSRFVMCDGPTVSYGVPTVRTAQEGGGVPARGEAPPSPAVQRDTGVTLIRGQALQPRSAESPASSAFKA